MKLLPESVESINKRLIDYFGLFENGEPNWKLVWSEDELEKRLMTHTDSGIELVFPEVRLTKKFGYIKERYVLTRLVAVPEYQIEDLAGAKLSYEPIWTFEDVVGNETTPYWEAIQVIIQTLYDQVLNAGHKVPKKPGLEDANTEEALEYRANKIYEQLYGDESAITDALSNDNAIGYGIRNRN